MEVGLVANAREGSMQEHDRDKVILTINNSLKGKQKKLHVSLLIKIHSPPKRLFKCHTLIT